MPLKLAAPIEKTFNLEETDRIYGVDEPTMITVRQAGTGEVERRTAMFTTLVKETDVNGSETVRQRLSFPELYRLEVYLTLAACNICGSDGKQLFRFTNTNGVKRLAMSEPEFDAAWAKLPVEVSREIHSKVYEVNLTWNPFAQGMNSSEEN